MLATMFGQQDLSEEEESLFEVDMSLRGFYQITNERKAVILEKLVSYIEDYNLLNKESAPYVLHIKRYQGYQIMCEVKGADYISSMESRDVLIGLKRGLLYISNPSVLNRYKN